MHVATLTTPSGATREFILGHPQQDTEGRWFLNAWPADDLRLTSGEMDE